MGTLRPYVIRKFYFVKSSGVQFFSPLFKALIFVSFLIHCILKYMTLLKNMLIIKPLPGRMMRPWSPF